MEQIKALVFNDPSCPFGYSASPALRTLEWRYRDQIQWHLAVIGLSSPESPPAYSPAELSGFLFDFRRRYRMPFAIEPKSRTVTTSRSCQVITAARLLYPGSEWKVLRTLQLLHFNTPLLLDDDDQLAEALESVAGIEPATVMASLDTPQVQSAYEADWAHARSAEGTPGHLQGKTADSDEGARYTAPSVIFELGDKRLEATGFQTIEAYDVIVANLNPDLNRAAPASEPLEALALYPAGLTTAEVAAIMAADMTETDHDAVEGKLVTLLGDGRVSRVSLGNDALWTSV